MRIQPSLIEQDEGYITQEQLVIGDGGHKETIEGTPISIIEGHSA